MNSPTIWSRHHSHKPIKLNPTSKKIVINFGHTEIAGRVKDATIINHPSAVENCADKIAMKIFMQSLVTTPPFGVDFKQTPALPLVVKRKAHSRGKGMSLINSQYELDAIKYRFDLDRYYWEQFIVFDREFRVHCSRHSGEIFATEKVRRRAATGPNWIRNLESCRYKAKFIRPPGWETLLEECKSLLNALGLDLGGLDIGYNVAQAKFYIIECNSACGMEDNTRAAYTKELNAICGKIDEAEVAVNIDYLVAVLDEVWRKVW